VFKRTTKRDHYGVATAAFSGWLAEIPAEIAAAAATTDMP
jgi:hypothetical protein